MTKISYGQFGPSHFKAIQKGLKLYNEGFYWECHEELEDPWLEDVGDQARLIYWIIIQVATALYHHRNGNDTGAKSMLAKALKKREQLRGKNIETSMLMAINWQAFDDILQEISGEASAADFERLKNFRFALQE